jgi:hypothetical protein
MNMACFLAVGSIDCGCGCRWELGGEVLDSELPLCVVGRRGPSFDSLGCGEEGSNCLEGPPKWHLYPFRTLYFRETESTSYRASLCSYIYSVRCNKRVVQLEFVITY